MKRLINLLKCVMCRFVMSLVVITSLFAQEPKSPDFEGVENIKVGGEWFLSYENGQFRGGEVNRFLLNRGYIIVEKQLAENLSARITPDISVDEEGDGRGDIEMRIKYLHLKYTMRDVGFISKPYFEIGIAHRPWLVFEEHINSYRVQGKMFLERAKIYNSADLGISFFALFGDQMDATYQKNVNSHMPGRWGSFAVGVYNGGGYHAIEENINKTIESRITIRPLPDVVPGLQFSYTGAFGKGNISTAPDWRLSAGAISFELERFVVMGQYFQGLGNSFGSFIDSKNKSLQHDGYSFFCEYKFPELGTNIFARYDACQNEWSINNTSRIIGGIAYHFAQKCKLVLNYDYYTDGVEEDKPSTSIVKVDVLVKF
jgi:hypothetical protein